ncbi:hypothetical protein [Paenibacillus ginsengarvi]|uniref:DUF4878 domain-containing protein n=1 Tax=Paenibacillus ginsengarvi TaxID=400777 RepID=A0A3B0BUL1_9BACL|nr:hypothetical protein [Paenibacillus ginsengarvi]RKN77095.1 hypothetical protein D7M11_24040 [Paenibacillus ginsengarvi]
MKKTIVLFGLVVAAIAMLFMAIIFNSSKDPHSARHAKARTTIEQFYNAFKHNIGDTIPYLTTSPAYLANYRFYYGDIQGYTISSIKDADSDHKIAVVQVKTEKSDGSEVTYTDTLQLAEVGGTWLISKYTTNSTEGWPTLP